MKRLVLLSFVILNLITFSREKDEVEETRDIRKYHQQLEERVFEVEDDEVQEEKIEEAFSHGKKRISDLKKNLLQELISEGKKTDERLETVELLEDKYNEILKEVEELSKEKEKLIKENKQYESKLKSK